VICMFDYYAQIVFALMASCLILRKVTLSTSALQNNAASFVNNTGKRLHIRKSTLAWMPETTATAIGDSAIASLDEQPVIQANVNDSRSHIQSATIVAAGATGQIEAMVNNSIMIFNRNDLVVDIDEAIFLNTSDVKGSIDATCTANLWYEE